MTKHFIQIGFSLILLTIFVSCASAPRFTSKKSPNNPKKPPESETEYIERYANSGNVLEVEIGLASYYADDFHGRLTFTEEVYDMNGTTAAHPTYPMNTIIRVTNTSNNKQITIRINDRMPQHRERIIDLSLGTARELDMVEEGIAEVKIEVLKWGE
jgi:rare lipoprotein A